MIYFIKFWREFLLIILLCSGYFYFDKYHDAKHEIELNKILHKSELAKMEINFANQRIEYERQRKEDVELYAKQVNIISSKYSDLLNDNDRMRQQITSFNSRISSATREAVENYAKAAATVYAECRTEYIKMGLYASKMDAELDSLTKSPN